MPLSGSLGQLVDSDYANQIQFLFEGPFGFVPFRSDFGAGVGRAAGKLRVSGDLAAVLPLDDEVTHREGNPIQPDGTVQFDSARTKAREAAMVKRLLAAGEPVAVIVLGTGHDLAELLKDHSVEYIRVMLKSIPAPDSAQ